MLNPWLDSAELRRLAESLAKPPRKPATAHEEAGFDDDFVGFLDEPTVTGTPATQEISAPIPVVPLPPADPSLISISPTPRPPAEIAPPARPVVSASPPPAAGPPPTPGKFQPFGQWMCQRYAATGIFIVDRQAHVIFDQGRHDKLHFLAISVARNLQRLGTTAAKVHIHMGGGAILEVIPVETSNGYLVLGAVVAQTLDSTAVADVTTALRQAATATGPTLT